MTKLVQAERQKAVQATCQVILGTILPQLDTAERCIERAEIYQAYAPCRRPQNSPKIGPTQFFAKIGSF